MWLFSMLMQAQEHARVVDLPSSPLTQVYDCMYICDRHKLPDRGKAIVQIPSVLISCLTNYLLSRNMTKFGPGK